MSKCAVSRRLAESGDGRYDKIARSPELEAFEKPKKTGREQCMATDITTEPQGTPPEVMEDLRKAAEYAMKGVLDPEVMRKACEDMDRMAEKNAQLYGVHDDGVDIIREMRDSR